MAITKEAVFAACDAMFSEGQAPSTIKVRAVLGSGSFGTIGPWIAEWKLKGSGASAEEEPLPEQLGEVIERFGRALWAAAREAARGEFSEAEVRWERRLGEVQQQNAELTAACDVLADDLGRLRASESELAGAESQVKELREKLREAEEGKRLAQAQHDGALKMWHEAEERSKRLESILARSVGIDDWDAAAVAPVLVASPGAAEKLSKAVKKVSK